MSNISINLKRPQYIIKCDDGVGFTAELFKIGAGRYIARPTDFLSFSAVSDKMGSVSEPTELGFNRVWRSRDGFVVCIDVWETVQLRCNEVTVESNEVMHPNKKAKDVYIRTELHLFGELADRIDQIYKKTFYAGIYE